MKNVNLNKQISNKNFKESSTRNISKSNLLTANEPTLSEEIENLKSIYYQLEFLNLKLINTFSNQKILAEEMFYEKIDEIIKIRESNFNLFGQINSIKNISKIEEYLGTVYSKIHSIESKLANVLENINDFKLNINYGLDRFYLEENIVCDENSMIKNLETTTQSLVNVMTLNRDKFTEIETLRENYLVFINLIQEENLKIEKIKNILQNKKEEVLEESLNKISLSLHNDNGYLEENLFN
jgi:hypothetical protein